MKILTFIFIFFCSIEQFLSSPITKADDKTHSDLVKTLDPSLKSTPKTDKITTINSKIDKEEKEKVVPNAKSTEIGKHTTDGYKSSNVEIDKISLGITSNAPLKNGLGKLSSDEKHTENQHTHDFGRHEQAAVFNSTPLSEGTSITVINKVNSDEKRLFRNIISEKTSKEKREKDNLREILNNSKEVVVLNNDVFEENSNKVDLQTSQEIKTTFSTSSTAITNENKTPKISNHSGNNLLENHRDTEKLDLKKSIGVNLKDKRNIKEDTANVFQSSNVKLNDSEQNSSTESKTFNLLEEIARKYQQNVPNKLTTIVGTISEKGISPLKSEKPAIEKNMENLGISDDKTSSKALDIANNKQQANNTDKETKKDYEKVKSLESEKSRTEKKTLNYSTSTVKQNGSDAKLTEVDRKQHEKSFSNTFTTSKNKLITTAKENSMKFIIETVQ